MIRAALVLAAAASLAVAVEGSAAATGPRLRILDTSPLVLRGQSFEPLEKIHVVATAGRRTVRRTVVADADGAFRLRFAGLEFGRCQGDRDLEAVGSAGSRVELQLRVPLDCGSGGAGAV